MIAVRVVKSVRQFTSAERALPDAALDHEARDYFVAAAQLQAKVNLCRRISIKDNQGRVGAQAPREGWVCRARRQWGGGTLPRLAKCGTCHERPGGVGRVLKCLQVRAINCGRRERNARPHRLQRELGDAVGHDLGQHAGHTAQGLGLGPELRVRVSDPRRGVRHVQAGQLDPIGAQAGPQGFGRGRALRDAPAFYGGAALAAAPDCDGGRLHPTDHGAFARVQVEGDPRGQLRPVEVGRIDCDPRLPVVGHADVDGRPGVNRPVGVFAHVGVGGVFRLERQLVRVLPADAAKECGVAREELVEGGLAAKTKVI